MKKILPNSAAVIADGAKKAFEGEIFDVYQWAQKMFDGTTKTFEMLRRPDTVQILAIKDDQLILIQDAQPGRPVQIHLPGGRPDPEDTSWLDTAKRELLEETGLEFNDWRLIKVEQPVIKIEWFTPIFLATNFVAEHPLALDPGGERIAVKPHTFELARKLILSGKYPATNHLIPLLSQVDSLEALVALPEFMGQEVDR